MGASCPHCGINLPAKNRTILVTVDDDGTVVSTTSAPPPPLWKRTPFIVGAVIVVILIAAVVSSMISEDSNSGSSNNASSGSNTSTTSDDTPTTTLPPVLAQGSGTGDDVVEIDIPDTPAIVTFTHVGTSNFSVWSLDQGLDNIDLLVNTIGNYDGTRPMQFTDDEAVTGFEISADGNWTYLIAPLSEIRGYSCPINGKGDDVIAVRDFTSSAGTADLAFTADTNFAIWAWGDTGRDLIVNEIGPYSGTVRVSSGLFVWDITGNEGTWTIDCG